MFFALSDKERNGRDRLFEARKIHYLAFGEPRYSSSDIDITRPVPAPLSVTISTLEVALYMGFKEVYLLGCDHHWILHSHESSHLHQENAHAFAQVGGNDHANAPGETYFEGQCQHLVNLWRQYRVLDAIAKTKGTQIFNATEGGILDLFPRVRLNSLFSEKVGVQSILDSARNRLAHGDIEEARQSLETASRAYPQNADIIFALGECLRRSGDLEASRSVLLKAAGLNPKLAAAEATLASVLSEMRRDSEAKASALRALALEPSNSEAIDVLFETGNFEEGRKAFFRSVVYPPVESLTELVDKNGLEGIDLSEARAVAREAIKLGRDPTKASALKALSAETGGRPVLEFAPAGWKTKLNRQGQSGWNQASVIAAEVTKWDEFCRNLELGGPLGFSNKHSDLSVVRDASFHNLHLTFGYVVALASIRKAEASVLEWGGGIGHYYVIAKALLPDVIFDYHIKEVPAMAEVGKILSPDVHWHADDACLRREYDLVMVNGSLQYIESWAKLLSDLARCVSHGGYFLLTRLPVVETVKGFVAVQRAYGAEMLHQQLNRTEVLRAVESTGLHFVRELVVGDRPNILGAPQQCELKGWLFRRK